MARGTIQYAASGKFASTGVDDNGDATTLTIDANENLGIGGVSPIGTHSTLTSVRVGGNAIINHTTASAASGSLDITQNANYDTDGSWEYIVTDEVSRYQQSGGEHIFSAAASGTAGNDITWTESMRILSDGKVGIGITTPSEPLQVYSSPTKFSVGGSENVQHGARVYNSGDDVFLEFSIPENASKTRSAQIVMDYNGNSTLPSLDFYVGSFDHSSVHANTLPLTHHMSLEGGNVGIGTTSPSSSADTNLHVKGTSTASIHIEDDEKRWEHYVNGYYLIREVGSSTNNRFFIEEDTGKVGIGTTAPSQLLHVNGGIGVTGISHSGSPTTNLIIGNDTSHSMSNSNEFLIRSDRDNLGLQAGNSTITYFRIYTNSSVRFEIDGAYGDWWPGADNTTDIGYSSRRMDDIYATNGTINTSDKREKQDIEELSEAEQRVAVAAKGLLRKYRWKSSVEKKGDDARIHFGVIAQDLKSAFEVEGLDVSRYALFIHTEWWESEETTIDDEGVQRTQTKTHQTEKEAPEGAVKRDRLGLRYNELLAFIMSAI